LDNAEIKSTLEMAEASERDVFLALRARRNSW